MINEETIAEASEEITITNMVVLIELKKLIHRAVNFKIMFNVHNCETKQKGKNTYLLRVKTPLLY